MSTKLKKKVEDKLFKQLKELNKWKKIVKGNKQLKYLAKNLLKNGEKLKETDKRLKCPVSTVSEHHPV